MHARRVGSPGSRGGHPGRADTRDADDREHHPRRAPTWRKGIDLTQLVAAIDATDQDLEAVPAGATCVHAQGVGPAVRRGGDPVGRAGAAGAERVAAVGDPGPAPSPRSCPLIGQSDLVLQVLNQRHAAIEQLITSAASLTTQLEALLAAHQAQVGPLLADLQTVSGGPGQGRERPVDGHPAPDRGQPLPEQRDAVRVRFGDFVMPAALIPDNVIAACSKPGAINPLNGCNP